ncbi:hypothetical protein [Roseibium alexandrii]|uniref:Uncharacterized protein n=1 Tax=Roseibium alexandrii (strain DSM 17067 / NCIMB 14079 / DFL-11) TaxID=244592 RepID=A0A5E8H1U1_ROSAD|nr:hypothetical protein [Roseibium alexandrii]EEE46505.1 hypothetical protein SADFL11_3794 [Roseibium alexandrii DFL-11]
MQRLTRQDICAQHQYAILAMRTDVHFFDGTWADKLIGELLKPAAPPIDQKHICRTVDPCEQVLLSVNRSVKNVNNAAVTSRDGGDIGHNGLILSIAITVASPKRNNLK